MAIPNKSSNFAPPEPAKPLNDAQMCGSFYVYADEQQNYFLNIISPNNDMKAKIDALLADYPDIDTAAMGMPRGWENEPLWQ